MTPQEVIDILKILTTDKFQRCTSSEFDDAIYVAIKALEKQIPKPIYEHIETRLIYKVRYDKFRCSECGFTKEFVDGHIIICVAIIIIVFVANVISSHRRQKRWNR